MKVIGVNGGPRKGHNTHMLLDKALEGAASSGCQTETVHLYDLGYQGCISCLACKRKGSRPRCVVQDDLTPVLDKILTADGLILGSPIYFAEVTGALRSLWERLVFPFVSYDSLGERKYSRTLHSLLIFTMNAPEAALEQIGYTARFQYYADTLARMFGPCAMLASTETMQVEDYSKYEMGLFDAAQRQERRQSVFARDCETAFALGARLTQ